MTRNRRNYYRILHVQPEAPAEIIRASFRTLMGPLAQHPDKGGDHEAASLINEAYAVLGDPERRAAYDRSAAAPRRGGRAADRPAAAGPAGSRSHSGSAQADGASSTAPDPALWQSHRCCPFCRAALASMAPNAQRCGRCAAPLTPMPRPEPRRKELLGARTSTRIAKKHVALLYTTPGGAPIPVRMRDLSLTGGAVAAHHPLPARQPVRIVDGGVEAIGVVVACRRRDSVYTLHLQWLTISVGQRTGVFVSEHA